MSRCEVVQNDTWCRRTFEVVHRELEMEERESLN